MTPPPPWLREWKAVRELYARLEALKDQRRREAELYGINTKARNQEERRK